TVRAPKQASKVDGRHGYPSTVLTSCPERREAFMIMLAAAFIVAAVVFYERGRHPPVAARLIGHMAGPVRSEVSHEHRRQYCYCCSAPRVHGRSGGSSCRECRCLSRTPWSGGAST